MKFKAGDRVQIIWNGPPSVWKVWNVIKTPPPRWDTEGTEQISYCLMKDSDKYPGTIDIPEEELKHVR